MPAPGTPLEKLGFLTIGLFDAPDPRLRKVVFALPFSFEQQDYVQILTDIATRLGPALGWRSADHA